MIGLCKALEAFHPYLIMNHFTILTDNTALATHSLKNHTLNIQRLARIDDVLSQFTFDIYHVKGTQNLLADYLLRAKYKETINTIQSICKFQIMQAYTQMNSDIVIHFFSTNYHLLHHSTLSLHWQRILLYIGTSHWLLQDTPHKTTNK